MLSYYNLFYGCQQAFESLDRGDVKTQTTLLQATVSFFLFVLYWLHFENQVYFLVRCTNILDDLIKKNP